ncbi:MAG: tetratricopeptide repeat protein, partial [Planctomycetota bacterium]
PGLWMIRARGRLMATRIGQLLTDIAGRFRPSGKDFTEWRGMEMFVKNPVAADDPRLATTYEDFRKNLTDICGVARNAGAAVVLSTVAVNLKDCPPLGSQHRPDLTPEDLKQWDALYKEGSALESDGKGREAIEKFLAAEKIDAGYAELQFHLGRCLAAGGERAAARGRFGKARDLDVMRFRIDSRENAIVRDVAGGAKDGVYLADAEAALAACGIPDKELFYEHVHCTFEGNYQVARALLGPVDQALQSRLGAPDDASIPSKTSCAEWLAMTPWNEFEMARKMTEGITSRPPFTNQLDHSLRLAAERERLKGLHRLGMAPEALQAAWKTYEAALARSGDDWTLRQHFAELAMQCGRPDEAIRQGRVVVAKLPWEAPPKWSLAKALMAAGKLDEAIDYSEQALRISPNSPEVYCGLGTALGQKGKSKEALGYLKEALRLIPEFSEAHNSLGNVLTQGGKIQEALDHYEEAVRINPNNAEAQANLGNTLLRQGKPAQAVEAYQQVVRLSPRQAGAHCNLGVAFGAVGDPAQAAAQFAEALRLKPDLLTALNELAWIRATNPAPSLRDGSEAVRLASRVCQLTGRKQPGCLDTLAAAQAEAGQFPLAVQTAEEALVLAIPQKALAQEIRQRLAMYSLGQAFRDHPPVPTTRP